MMGLHASMHTSHSYHCNLPSLNVHPVILAQAQLLTQNNWHSTNYLHMPRNVRTPRSNSYHSLLPTLIWCVHRYRGTRHCATWYHTTACPARQTRHLWVRLNRCTRHRTPCSHSTSCSARLVRLFRAHSIDVHEIMLFAPILLLVTLVKHLSFASVDIDVQDTPSHL